MIGTKILKIDPEIPEMIGLNVGNLNFLKKFLGWKKIVPTLNSIISGVSRSIFKIFVAIM